MDSGESSLSTVLSPRGETLLFATICPLLLLVLLYCSKCQIKLGIYSNWRKRTKVLGQRRQQTILETPFSILALSWRPSKSSAMDRSTHPCPRAPTSASTFSVWFSYSPWQSSRTSAIECSSDLGSMGSNRLVASWSLNDTSFSSLEIEGQESPLRDWKLKGNFSLALHLAPAIVDSQDYHTEPGSHNKRNIRSFTNAIVALCIQCTSCL